VSFPDAVEPAEVHQLLLRRGQTVAVAESLTGGLLGAALTSTPGSSATFRGAMVVYATDLKESLAGVPGPLLAAEGPVSAHVAAALAAGARDRLGATYGVGVTGVAGPEPQNGQPVGTVHLAVAGPAEGEVRSMRWDGDREQIRARAVAAALSLLADVVAHRG
jgi:nicotinamide-nucleotide amidase